MSAEPLLLYERNRRFLSGQSCHLAQEVDSLGYGILFIVMGLALAAVFVWSQRDDYLFWQRLYRDGRRTDATVVRLYLKEGRRSPSHMVVYRIEVEPETGFGEKIDRSSPVSPEREILVSQKEYDRLSVGQRIAALYLPDDPAQSRLAFERPFYTVVGAWVAVAVVFVIPCLGAAAWFLWRYRRLRWLARHGQVLEGVLVGCTSPCRGKVRVECRVRTPAGGDLVASAERRVLPIGQPGTPMWVLYLTNRRYVIL
jgi:hypothetical protein